MTEKHDGTGQRREFSFKKKPVEKYVNNSNVHSVISDIIPRSSSRPITSNNQTNGTDGENEAHNNVNYDEQIRAPRMSSVSRSFKDKGGDNYEPFGEGSLTTEAKGLWKVQEDRDDERVLEDSYTPANFDLSQPTRRFSIPYEVASGAPDTTILSYTTDNYIYERNRSVSSSNSNSSTKSNTNTNLKDLNLDMLLVASAVEGLQQANLTKALDNLSSNVTSQERNDVLITNCIKHRPQTSAGHLSEVEGTVLQQVYRLKKPLCTPAVLRPQNVSSISTALSPYLAGSAETSPRKMSYSISIDCDATSSPHCESRQPSEPTHTHWKPNSYTSSCMKCFEVFGNFFSPQRRRRHHCRFCGQIFCFKCLWQKRNADHGIDSNIIVSVKDGGLDGTTLLDTKARFVIPIYANLQTSSNVQTLTDLFRNCKVCKDCGHNYYMLVTNINANLTRFLTENNIKNFKLPCIFIENSYANTTNPLHQTDHHDIKQDVAKDESDSNNANSTHTVYTTTTAPNRAKSSATDASINDNSTDASITDPLRKSSVASVPSDWTWSSF